VNAWCKIRPCIWTDDAPDFGQDEVPRSERLSFLIVSTFSILALFIAQGLETDYSSDAWCKIRPCVWSDDVPNFGQDSATTDFAGRTRNWNSRYSS
jgi:hypothetical protein